MHISHPGVFFLRSEMVVRGMATYRCALITAIDAAAAANFT